MDKERPTKIDIVKVQMVKDGTIDYGKKAIKGPQDLAELGHKFIQNADREVFLLVCLNTRNHINCIHVVSIGTINTALVAPREVMKVAILSSASGIACIHNHPSGDPEPSNDDIQITNRIAECGRLFGIGLLDHVIISDGGKYESLLEKGLITKTSELPLSRIEEREGRSSFGRYYWYMTHCRRDSKNVPKKLMRFEEFTQRMKKLALREIEKQTKTQKKDPIHALPNTLVDERPVHFALEDLVKKIIRFRNQTRERDLVKLALWTHLLWLRLYPKRGKGA